MRIALPWILTNKMAVLHCMARSIRELAGLKLIEALRGHA